MGASAGIRSIRLEEPGFGTLSLAEIAKAAAEKRLPPVDSWNPQHCGDSDMIIRRDGTWLHAGTPIGRPALVRLFATILRREPDGSYVLVTPVEKLSIAVEDAPLLAVEVRSEGRGPERQLGFRLATDELVMAGPANPLRFAVDADGTPRPYLHVRGRIGNGIEALVGRNAFYDLAEWALNEADGNGPVGLWSGGAFFAFPH
ncbi:MAG: DUF1285 domain-containing protein [Sphingomonadaceae bacterium]